MSARKTSAPDAASDDHDSPWKNGLEWFFPQAIAFLAPRLHAKIDWSEPAQFLDKELQAIVFPSKKGRRFVDKLVQVRLRSGADAWLLIHVEVEGRLSGRKALRRFAWRMYEYRHRTQARIMQQRSLDLPPPVYSLGVLLENRGVGDHLVYTDEHLGQGIRFTFPVVELEGWRTRWDELESLASSNPFAVLIMAQLHANHHPDKRTRLTPKFELVRGLRRYGYDPDVAGQVHHLVDWMIALPIDLESEYVRAVTALTEENNMAYVTSIERVVRQEALAEGRAEGQADLLLHQIERRFGPIDDDIKQRICSARTQELSVWSLNILDAEVLEDVFRD
ncbi:DUF4351 domain-containing protein [Castellaniella hirudinis]|uniref:DUF4351 domain-containing protein n=1 Tax=Castellaniella hirudinis TaxID=1144617 RepID=A0ABV8S0M5_9BURK